MKQKKPDPLHAVTPPAPPLDAATVLRNEVTDHQAAQVARFYRALLDQNMNLDSATAFTIAWIATWRVKP